MSKRQESSNKNFPDEVSDSELLRSGEKAVRAVLAFALLVIAVYLAKFLLPILNGGKFTLEASSFVSPVLSVTGDASVWGQFGDFFGGVLNPAIGLVTIYLVLVNVRLQKKELGNSLRELKIANHASRQQNIKSTFFQWLSTYREIVSNAEIDLTDAQGMKGVGALNKLYGNQFNLNRISNELKANDLSEFVDDFRNSHRIDDEEDAYQIRSTILQRWDTVNQTYNYILGPALRSLTGLLLWVEAQPPEISSESDKSEFIHILSSQLSNLEIKLLFLHTLRNNTPLLLRLKKQGMFDELGTFLDPTMCFLTTHGPYVERESAVATESLPC